MVFAYVLTSRLNAASQFVAIDRDNNAQVLSQAKRALIGWMAINAATDNNPGRLPCPQAWGDVGTTNEGRAAANCSVPAVGWLPWRTLGLDRPLGASGNQIWYVISPGWHLPSAGATLSINSDSTGQLTLSGQAAVALVVAPGAALAIAPNANQIAAGCAARNQSQVLALPGTPPNPLDFLECQNGSTADNVFAASVVDNAVNKVFNDQVLAITAADVMPALEAAIAERMQREIAPALQSVYTSSQYAGIPGSSPMYPYAAPFGGGPGTSASFQGVAGTYQGLLPFSQTQGCNPATDARCTTTLLAWSPAPPNPPPPAYKTGGYGSIQTQSCSWQSSNNVAMCEGEYREDSGNVSGAGMLIEMTATINNVARGLRRIDWTKAQVVARNDSPDPWEQVTLEPSSPPDTTMNTDGSVTVKFRARLPNIDAKGWVTWAQYRISLDRAVIGDHFLLDPATSGPGAATSWFVRNQWYRLLYYAVAQQNTAGALSAFDCTPSTNCLSFNATQNVRALLVLAGRSLGSPPAARPNGSLKDYLEYQNCDFDTTVPLDCVLAPDTSFEQRPMRLSRALVPALSAPWNDRTILVDWANPPSPSPNGPQVVSLTPLRIYTIP
jgi:hypothetical protein